MKTNIIHNLDALTGLRRLPDESVSCCITSPPYYGLRDYGIDGQLGLEPTPELYVQHLVEIFREVRRVLRKEGTFFLKLGDSYAGSCGTYGKELVNYQYRGCLCESLCDVCRQVYLNRKFHNDDLLISMLTASLSLSSHEHKVKQNDHLPTLDFYLLENHILNAIHEFGRFVDLEVGQLLSFQESMPDEFSRQLLVECWQRGNSSSCLLCGHSLTCNVRKYEYKMGEISRKVYYKKGNASCDEEQISHNQNKDKACVYCNDSYIQAQSTIDKKWCQGLKPKDLIGIPWRVAFALQADGWYLRSDIIWHKPNLMPESVTDRPTKSHEYIFLLTKSGSIQYWTNNKIGRMIDKQPLGTKGKWNIDWVYGPSLGETKSRRRVSLWRGHNYYYDAFAIQEVCQSGPSDIKKMIEQKARIGGKHKDLEDLYSKASKSTNIGRKRGVGDPSGRNKRSVWTVATQPYSEAHFAVYPDKLIEPCVLAGCPQWVCKKCGKARERIIEKEGEFQRRWSKSNKDGSPYNKQDSMQNIYKEKGWTDCGCGAGWQGGVVLDPFMGSGTSAHVAYKLGRRYIGFEISEEYCRLAEKRMRQMDLVGEGY